MWQYVWHKICDITGPSKYNHSVSCTIPKPEGVLKWDLSWELPNLLRFPGTDFLERNSKIPNPKIANNTSLTFLLTIRNPSKRPPLVETKNLFLNSYQTFESLQYAQLSTSPIAIGSAAAGNTWPGSKRAKCSPWKTSPKREFQWHWFTITSCWIFWFFGPRTMNIW